MRTDRFTIDSSDGLATHVQAWLAESPRGTVVFLPGLKGFVNWGGWRMACAHLCEDGFDVHAVDYSCCGVTDFAEDFNRGELTARNSVSRQVAEVLAVLAMLGPQVPVFLWGHSMGGATALLASRDRDDIAGVILWASVSTLRRWPDAVIEAWQRDGRLNLPNARTGADFHLGREWLADVLAAENSMSVLDAARAFRRPALIVQGTNDAAVRVEEANALAKAIGPDNARLVLIDGADHTFGVKQPFAGSTGHFAEALRATRDFLVQLTPA